LLYFLPSALQPGDGQVASVIRNRAPKGTQGGYVASGNDSSTNTRKLECSWPAAISTSGMSPEHRQRVQEIGLDAWMEE
jgi:hypothetical protein